VQVRLIHTLQYRKNYFPRQAVSTLLASYHGMPDQFLPWDMLLKIGFTTFMTSRTIVLL
jgi:hypothetical protein